MIRALPFFAPLALAACVTTQPAVTQVGEVRVISETYPIQAVDAATWRVMIDGRPVTCSKPDQDACYWSARHFILSQQDPDTVG